MRKGLIQFALKFLIFAVALFLVDRGIGAVLGHYFHKIASTEAARINYAVNEATEDMIIFGSSRANHHYVPTVFEDSMHLKCYNAGVDGEFILYHDCVLQCILKRKAPRVIIIDINKNEFSTKGNEEVYSKLSLLLPYYYSHKEIQPLVDMKSRFEKYKVLSDMYRYNSLISTIAVNNLRQKKDTSIHGYCPLYRELKNVAPTAQNDNDITLDTLKVEVFKLFISQAKAAGSKLFVFISPSYEAKHANTATVEATKRICIENNVPFYDYSQDSLFLVHPEYFSDPSHLNNVGAKLYSGMVYQKIKKA